MHSRALNIDGLELATDFKGIIHAVKTFCNIVDDTPDSTTACRVQALFNSLGDEVKGKTIGLGGDGRYFNKDAAQIIIKLAAAAGVKKARSNIKNKLLQLAALTSSSMEFTQSRL